MTYTEIIKKAKQTINNNNSSQFISWAYDLEKNQDDCTITVHSTDDNDCLISMRGEFGNVRITMTDNSLSIVTRKRENGRLVDCVFYTGDVVWES